MAQKHLTTILGSPIQRARIAMLMLSAATEILLFSRHQRYQLDLRTGFGFALLMVNLSVAYDHRRYRKAMKSLTSNQYREFRVSVRELKKEVKEDVSVCLDRPELYVKDEVVLEICRDFMKGREKLWLEWGVDDIGTYPYITVMSNNKTP